VNASSTDTSSPFRVRSPWLAQSPRGRSARCVAVAPPKREVGACSCTIATDRDVRPDFVPTSRSASLSFARMCTGTSPRLPTTIPAASHRHTACTPRRRPPSTAAGNETEANAATLPLDPPPENRFVRWHNSPDRVPSSACKPGKKLQIARFLLRSRRHQMQALQTDRQAGSRRAATSSSSAQRFGEFGPIDSTTSKASRRTIDEAWTTASKTLVSRALSVHLSAPSRDGPRVDSPNGPPPTPDDDHQSSSSISLTVPECRAAERRRQLAVSGVRACPQPGTRAAAASMSSCAMSHAGGPG